MPMFAFVLIEYFVLNVMARRFQRQHDRPSIKLIGKLSTNRNWQEHFVHRQLVKMVVRVINKALIRCVAVNLALLVFDVKQVCRRKKRRIIPIRQEHS